MKKGKVTPKGKTDPKEPINLMARLDTCDQSQRLLNNTFTTMFDLAAQSVTQLLAVDSTLHITQARPLLEQAKALTVSNARQFREQRLSTGVRTAYSSEPGIKGLVAGPTYTAMFNPNWAEQCPPGAIEATTSPIAYLTDLYREAEKIEGLATFNQNIPLAARRPDLAGLMLDHTTLNQVEPTLVLVNEILETSIRKHLNDLSQDDKLVDDAMLQARYPHTLPYERYQQQINHVLGTKQLSLGDAVRCIDSQYPYFKEAGGRSAHSDNALQLDTGFGPAQQKLLLEAPYFPADGTPSDSLSFFKTNYGKDSFTELLDTQTFCLQTGLSTDELDSLLSTGPYAPTQSPNVTPATGLAIDGALFGSVYINGGQKPAVAIQTETNGTAASHKLINITFDKFDRINRMIRLARWLGLPFDQVDRLLIASFTAQQQSETPTFTAATLQITTDTLRSLGLFQRLRASHKITVDDFAALLNGLATEGRGKELSQFDRVFNSQALFPHPFKLDDSEFAITPTLPGDIQKVDQLCAALGMSYEAYRFTAKLIKQSLDGVKPEGFKQEEPTPEPTLKWSNVVVSAFYRLVRLPRYLGLSTIEALALLELLDKGGSKLVSKLAGRTSVTLSSGATSDTLSAIHALVDFSTWLSDNQWPVSMICRTLLPGQSRSIASEVENSVIQQIYQGLDATLLTDNSFAEAAIPAPPASLKVTRKKNQAVDSLAAIDWFDTLKTFIDDDASNTALKGLILHHGIGESSFEANLGAAISTALSDKQYPADQIPALQEKLLTVILRSRDAQAALILEGLALYLAVPTHLATNLMQWAGGDRYQVLKDVIQYSTADAPASNVFLPLLSTLVNLAAVTSHLKLSPALIGLLAKEPAWFGLPNADLTLRCVYILTQYTQILSLSEQSEDSLLNYFQLINNAWPTAKEGDRPLYRDSGANKLATFLQWGAREVLAVGFHLHPATETATATKKTRAKAKTAAETAPIPGVIFTLAELDVLVRIAQMCRLIGLDGKALLGLGNLTFASTVQTYRRAAEQALSCLVEGLANKPSGEVGQSTTTTITVIDDYLVANMPTSNLSTLTLTLKDYMDVVMPETTITWRTNLGRLLDIGASDEEREGVPSDPGDSAPPVNTGELQLTTDENGQCEVLLKSGKIMGMARITAHYGLDSEALAPAITIDCDEKGLTLEALPPLGAQQARSNNEGAITFSVKLQDAYGNLAINRDVEWITTFGAFQSSNPRTNTQGISSVTLRSSPAGTGEVVATYLHNDGTEQPTKTFGPVTFTRHPYFQYVRFDDFVMQYMEEGLSCRLVELNGDPIPDKVITWKTTKGELTASSTTDSNGVATATFKHDVNEDVTITVSTEAIDSIAIPVKSMTAHVNLPPEIKRYSDSGNKMVMGTEALTFNVWLESEGKPARYVDMTWTVIDSSSAEEHNINKESDNNGKSTFSYGDFKVGTYKVRAAIDNVPDGLHEFDVTCVAPSVLGYTPAAPKYELGDNELEFSITLEVIDFVLPDISIVWSVNNEPIEIIKTHEDQYTDDTRTEIKISFKSKKFTFFTTNTVTATIEGTTTALHIFNVPCITRIDSYEPKGDPVNYFKGAAPVKFNIVLAHGATIGADIDITWTVNGLNPVSRPAVSGVSTFEYKDFAENIKTVVKAAVTEYPTVFNTFNVEVADFGFSNGSGRDIEYIIGQPSLDLWVELQKNGSPDNGTTVTWTDGATTLGDIVTAGQGRSTLSNRTFTEPVTTIKANVVNIVNPWIFTVYAYKPTIANSTESKVNYTHGDPDIKFGVRLTGNTKPASGLSVTWSITGRSDQKSITDTDGWTYFSAGKFLGNTNVTATIGTSGPQYQFTVTAHPIRFTTEIIGTLDPDVPNFLSRDAKYSLRVKTIGADNNPRTGIKYKLRLGGAPHETTVAHLDEEISSSLAGNNFLITIQPYQGSGIESPTDPINLELVIETTDNSAIQFVNFIVGNAMRLSFLIQNSTTLFGTFYIGDEKRDFLNKSSHLGNNLVKYKVKDLFGTKDGLLNFTLNTYTFTKLQLSKLPIGAEVTFERQVLFSQPLYIIPKQTFIIAAPTNETGDDE
ncbi:MAG: Tc toxin subunit A [Pseudomonadota bacterium]